MEREAWSVKWDVFILIMVLVCDGKDTKKGRKREEIEKDFLYLQKENDFFDKDK